MMHDEPRRTGSCEHETRQTCRARPTVKWRVQYTSTKETFISSLLDGNNILETCIPSLMEATPRGFREVTGATLTKQESHGSSFLVCLWMGGALRNSGRLCTFWGQQPLYKWYIFTNNCSILATRSSQNFKINNRFIWWMIIILFELKFFINLNSSFLGIVILWSRTILNTGITPNLESIELGRQYVQKEMHPTCSRTWIHLQRFVLQQRIEAPSSCKL